jgi:hypothetical protein
MMDRLHMGLVVAVLLMVGALLGSVLLEWGDRREALPANRAPASGNGSGVAATTPDAPRRVSLEVLNGAGDPGAAARYSERLRDMGFDVKTFGNARNFGQARTEVLDRSRREGAAQAIADALGGIPVRSEPAPQLYLDATLVLGEDWRDVLSRVSP